MAKGSVVQVTTGLKQSDALSPIFCYLTLEKLLREIEIN